MLKLYFVFYDDFLQKCWFFLNSEIFRKVFAFFSRYFCIIFCEIFYFFAFFRGPDWSEILKKGENCRGN